MKDVMYFKFLRSEGCICINERLYIKTHYRMMDIEGLLEEAAKVPEYETLHEIEALFGMHGISHALFSSVKNLNVGNEMTYDHYVVKKVSNNLFHVKDTRTPQERTPSRGRPRKQ